MKCYDLLDFGVKLFDFFYDFNVSRGFQYSHMEFYDFHCFRDSLVKF